MQQSFAAKPYESGHLRALLVITFLALGAAANVLAFIGNAWLTGMLGGAVDPNAVYGFGESLTEIVSTIGNLLNIVTFLMSAVLFLMWLHRAYRNLHALGARPLETTPGWAVGYFFIPFANLIKPFQVLREIWNKSDPQAEIQEGFGNYSMETPALVAWWWAFWLVANASSLITDLILSTTETIDTRIIAIWLSNVAHVLVVVASVLAILLIKKIDERQEARALLIGTREPPAPPESFESDFRV